MSDELFLGIDAIVDAAQGERIQTQSDESDDDVDDEENARPSSAVSECLSTSNKLKEA